MHSPPDYNYEFFFHREAINDSENEGEKSF